MDRYLPGVPASAAVTIRQLLNHTAGIRDYWPQDYLFAAELQPTTPRDHPRQVARQPPDFAAGADFQYSNTGYTAAGRIVEVVSGRGLMDFLRERLFAPLGLSGVVNCGVEPLRSPDAAAYSRTALGPVRPAPPMGAGWLFAAGELAMTPRDLAQWDVALLMDGRVLCADSLREMTTAVVLKNGRNAGYGLGVDVEKDPAGRRMISHDGAISGFTAFNRVWPEQRAAIAVTVNADWTGAAALIGSRLAALVMPLEESEADVRAFFSALQRGNPDAAKMSDNLRAFFTPEALRDATSGLGPLGPVRTLRKLSEDKRGGLTRRSYRAVCANGPAEIVLRAWPDGRYEQFNVGAVER